MKTSKTSIESTPHVSVDSPIKAGDAVMQVAKPTVAPFVIIMGAIPVPSGSDKRDLDAAIAFAETTGLPVGDAKWARDHALSRLPHIGKVSWTGNGTRSVSDAKIVKAYAEAYAHAKKTEPKGSTKAERLANAAREAKRLFAVITAIGSDKTGTFVIGE